MTKVLSVGGSIVVPEKPDTVFLSQFVSMVKEWLSEESSRKLILVVGGGAPARVYQNAYAEVSAQTGGDSAGGIRYARNVSGQCSSIIKTRRRKSIRISSFYLAKLIPVRQNGGTVRQDHRRCIGRDHTSRPSAGVDRAP